jgi:hypothetical protein
MLTQVTIFIIDTNPFEWYSLGQTFTAIKVMDKDVRVKLEQIRHQIDKLLN